MFQMTCILPYSLFQAKEEPPNTAVSKNSSRPHSNGTTNTRGKSKQGKKTVIPGIKGKKTIDNSCTCELPSLKRHYGILFGENAKSDVIDKNLYDCRLLCLS